MSIDLVPFQPLFLVIASLGLWLSLCTEQSQIVAKTRGAFAGKIATGYLSALKIMIINRAGAILYVFFVSLSIDTGISNESLLSVAICACIGVMIYNLFLVARRAVVLGYRADTSTERLWDFLVRKEKFHSVASFAATLCNILGLTLPFLLSNTFPEYRLTMANTGFLLNIFFTMMTVLIIETRYAYILDHCDNSEAYFFVVKVFVARAIATLAAIAVFAAVWLFLH